MASEKISSKTPDSPDAERRVHPDSASGLRASENSSETLRDLFRRREFCNLLDSLRHAWLSWLCSNGSEQTTGACARDRLFPQVVLLHFGIIFVLPGIPPLSHPGSTFINLEDSLPITSRRVLPISPVTSSPVFTCGFSLSDTCLPNQQHLLKWPRPKRGIGHCPPNFPG